VPYDVFSLKLIEGVVIGIRGLYRGLCVVGRILRSNSEEGRLFVEGLEYIGLLS